MTVNWIAVLFYGGFGFIACFTLYVVILAGRELDKANELIAEVDRRCKEAQNDHTNTRMAYLDVHHSDSG